MALLDESACLALSSCDARVPSVTMDLLERFAQISDPRHAQWVTHPVAVVLALCAGAVVAGMRSFTAIAGWVTDTPTDLLVAVYAHDAPVPVLPVPPSKATIWRVLTEVDAADVDAAIGAWLADRAPVPSTTPLSPTTSDQVDTDQVDTGIEAPEPVVLAVEGKAVRGAIDAEGNQVRLLAAMTHQHGLVLAQTEVGAKTNEIPMLPTLLDELDITNAVITAVITADALHTQRATAHYLHDRKAEFVLCVKENQPALFACLNALPWAEVPISHTQTDRGHGRITRRTLGPARSRRSAFPYVHQVSCWNGMSPTSLARRPQRSRCWGSPA